LAPLDKPYHRKNTSQTEPDKIDRNLTAAGIIGLTIALVLTTVVWYPTFLCLLLPDGFVLGRRGGRMTYRSPP